MTTRMKICAGAFICGLTLLLAAKTATAHPDVTRGQCIAIAETSSTVPGGRVYGWTHGGCPAQLLSHYTLKLKKRVGDGWVTVATSADQPTAPVPCAPFEQYKTKVVLRAAEPGGGSAEVDKDVSRIFYCGG
jgi:hypothetical protein